MGEINTCDRNCPCSEQIHDCKFIVLTGGPGAGKTALLETLKKQLCMHVAILPEAAGIVFGGGFWRLDSGTARTASQKAIFHVQREMENLVLGENKWAIGLCDRGTLDGLAYWPGSEGSFFERFNTTKNKEYEKYTAVIHLRSPNLDHGYNHQNPLRTESAIEAKIIDDKIHKIWKDHSNYTMVESQSDFIEKIKVAYQKISFFVPSCCGGHFNDV